MERRPSIPKIPQLELESFQKRTAAQMKQNIDIQLELLKSMSNYKQAIDTLATESSNISQIVGKLAVSTITAYQVNKEYKHAASTANNQNRNDEAEEAELKQRNLNLALQQVVKFHTQMTQQMLFISNVIASDFERPLSVNAERYKDIVANWDKDLDKELKKHKVDIKQKEAEALKAGKSHKTEKLSNSLQEIALRVNDFERLRHERIDAALVTDHHQYLLVAHHLQRVLKAEVTACRAIYYQDGVLKSKTTQNLPGGSNPSVPPPLMPQIQTSSEERQIVQTRSKSIPTLNIPTIRPSVNEEPPLLSPAPPPRRSSHERQDTFVSIASFNLPTIPDTPAPPPPSQKPPQYPIIPQQQQSKQQSTPDRSIESPVKEQHAYPFLSNQYPTLFTTIKSPPVNKMSDTPILDKKPTMPEHPHRHTLLQDDLFDGNSDIGFFGKRLDTTGAVAVGERRKSAIMKHRMSLMVLDEKSFESDDYKTTAPWNSKKDSWKENIQNQLIEEDEELVLVMYDYIGAEPDDLNVIEGDVLRIVAVEGEWLYGMLLVPSQPGSEEYIPAEINNALQIGWVPRSFTVSL